MKTIEWIRTHVVATAAIGAMIVAGSGGAAAIAVSNAPQSDVVEAITTPTPDPLTLPTQSDDPTITPTAAPNTGGDTQPPSGGDDTPTTPPVVVTPTPVTPEPEPPAPPPTPGAPTSVNITGDGTNFTVTWGTPNMNGATLSHYWVDITNPSYTTGDRYTPIYGNTLSGSHTLTCVVVAAVTTEGVQGQTAGPYCY